MCILCFVANEIREHDPNPLKEFRETLKADLYLLTDLGEYNDDAMYDAYHEILEKWMLWDSPALFSWDRFTAVFILFIWHMRPFWQIDLIRCVFLVE